MAGKLWDDLLEFVQNFENFKSYKHNHEMYKLLISSWLIQYFCAFLQFVSFYVMKCFPIF